MNKKTKILILFVSQILVFNSCKMIQISSLHPEVVLSKKLPGLQIINGINKPMTFNYGIYYVNNIYQDADILYTRDIQDNITNSSEEKYGYAEFKTILGQHGYAGWGWAGLSGFTLCIPNLLGMPLGNAKTSLEIELNILNSEKKVIGRYVAEGYAKVPIALYYGYSSVNAIRTANLKALKMALKNINMQVEKDADMLNNKLIEAGKIK
jgi:hypothetical protein